MASRISPRPIKDYSRFLTRIAARREPSPTRALQPLYLIPGVLSLGGGMPNPSLFPIAEVSIKLKDNTGFELKGNTLETALQYSGSYGLPSLLKTLRELQKREHSPPLPDEAWAICVTNGSQEGLCRAFEALIEENDPVLVESPTYSGAISALRPLGADLVAVASDAAGIIPSELEKVLRTWDSSKKRPKLLYLIPTGQNPSGSTLSSERRVEVYRIASEFDILILEDDPYWNLRFPSASSAPLRSFLSMDVDGRVLRFDSFSKVISSGLRIGWATGPTPLIESIQLHQQAGTMHPSGLSQTIVNSLFEQWGWDGWESHVSKVQHFYQERRDRFAEMAKRHLTGLAEWSVPTAGMFLWFKLNGIEDTRELIQKDAIHKKVILIPGSAFDPTNKQGQAIPNPTPYVRASFSVASYEEGEEAFRRFAELIRDAQQKKK